MNYGLYLSANGISASQHKMNVLANNLSNVNTTGFKPSQVVLGELLFAARFRAEVHPVQQRGTGDVKRLSVDGPAKRIGRVGLAVAVRRVDARRLEISVRAAGYDITAPETLTIVVPKAALLSQQANVTVLPHLVVYPTPGALRLGGTLCQNATVSTQICTNAR